MQVNGYEKEIKAHLEHLRERDEQGRIKDKGEKRTKNEKDKTNTGIIAGDFSGSDGLYYIIFCTYGKPILYGISLCDAGAAVINLCLYVYLPSCKR